MLLALILLSGCTEYDADCLPVSCNTVSCGDQCIPAELQADLIDRFIDVFSSRHGHGAEIEKPLRSLRITWVDGWDFWEARAGRSVTGVTYNTDAVKIACKGHILGWTALSWELMNVSLWTIYGHPCEDGPEWTNEHTNTIELVDEEFQ